MAATSQILPPGDPAPELIEGRLWVDGCFDFFHHGEFRPILVRPRNQSHGSDRSPHSGHAGAVVQARQLGDELYVGVHSDEAILENKGPTVMNQTERYLPPFPTPLTSTSH